MKFPGRALVVAVASCCCIPSSGQAWWPFCTCEGPSYPVLGTEARRLNHRFYPYERRLDQLFERAEAGYCVSTETVRRLVLLDERVQHVNATVILKQEKPCKVQKEIKRIHRDLCEFQSDEKAKTLTASHRTRL